MPRAVSTFPGAERISREAWLFQLLLLYGEEDDDDVAHGLLCEVEGNHTPALAIHLEVFYVPKAGIMGDDFRADEELELLALEGVEPKGLHLGAVWGIGDIAYKTPGLKLVWRVVVALAQPELVVDGEAAIVPAIVFGEDLLGAAEGCGASHFPPCPGDAGQHGCQKAEAQERQPYLSGEFEARAEEGSEDKEDATR